MSFWEIRNEADDGAAEILLYGSISDEDFWDSEATSTRFAEELAELGGRDVVVRINSRGGDVFAAQAVYNQLRRYSGRVDVTIDGMAASAATIIACAGQTVTMPDNTTYLIHNPMNMLFGAYTETELKSMADALKIVKQTIVNVYKKKCGDKISEEEIVKMMDEETILTADEALQYGFVDSIDEENSVTGSLNKGCLVINSVEFNADSFKNVGKIMDILHKNNKKEPEKVEKEKKTGFLDKVQQIIDKLHNKSEEMPQAEDKAAAAVKAERERIKALNALKVPGNVLINNIINEAFDDETVTAEKLKPMIDEIKGAGVGEDAKNAVQNMIKDSIESGAYAVPAAPKDNKGKDIDGQAIDVLSGAFKNAIEKKYGGKK